MSTSSQYPRSVHVTVHLDALAHNYKILKERASSQVFAVIKADAYGHGADAVASYLSSIADGFAVVTVGEGIAVRDAGVTQPVLVMQGPQDDDDMDAVFQFGLWPALHDEEQIERVQRHRNAIDIEPWIKVDTGMGRLGVSPESAEAHLAKNQLRWQGLMSHFSSADDLSSPKTAFQIDSLHRLKKRFELPLSLANSAGVLGWPAARTDWARTGIGLYGGHALLDGDEQDWKQEVRDAVDTSDEELDAGARNRAYTEQSRLKPAMTVEAPIVSVKTLSAGHAVGYAETFRCPETMSIAYAAVGYADGLPRVLDETASVIVRGVACPLIGRVSMDSIAIDCRPLNVLPSLGERITLWGGAQSVEHLAQAAGTISYELLTGIRGRRRYTD